MPLDERPPSAEREQTDQSLRVEREKVDDVLVEQLTAMDETADAIISRARARADEVLAAARARMDRQASDLRPSARLTRERVREDEALRKEREGADQTLREERAEQVAMLSLERRETDNDLLRERRRADDALATRDEFLSIVSHDLRNLLNAMVGFAALIEKGVRRKNHEAEVLSQAQRIQRSGARMNRLIGDLIDVASIEAGRLAVTPELASPAQVATEAVDTFTAQAAARGVSIVAELVPPSELAAFDPARILQVLVNLLSNAIKFTPVNGKIVVRVERLGDEIRFAVSDTGVGIPTGKLVAVFERFLQIKPNDRQGVGLGLYISKGIVQGHGGRIWAESRMDHGSTFYFTLPIHIAP